MTIASFHERYHPPRSPVYPDDSSPLSKIPLKNHGAALLCNAPATDVELGCPPRGTREKGSARYLWVIDDTGIPYIFEIRYPLLENTVPKHTNLTGGAPAYMGGELWFFTSESIYFSGGSSRYAPRNAEHLDDAATVFEDYGYEVYCLGWDPEEDKALRGLIHE